MSAIYRQPIDYGFGTLSLAAAVSDTSVASTDFTGLGTQYSATIFLPIVLHNPALKTHEVVWATAHGAGSNQLTVVRGKEGSSAQAWPAGTQWISAPTAARDGLLATTAAALATLSDLHVGASAVETDTGNMKVQTANAGLQPDVGVALPADIGVNRGGAAPPAGSAMIMRSGFNQQSTNSSGQIVITFARPFPNGVHIGGVSAAGGVVLPVSVVSETATALTVQVWQWTALNTAAAAAAGITVPMSYWAIGY